MCQIHNIPLQAFINTAKEIYQKIQDGVFDISNEVLIHVYVWTSMASQCRKHGVLAVNGGIDDLLH